MSPHQRDRKISADGDAFTLGRTRPWRARVLLLACVWLLSLELAAAASALAGDAAGGSRAAVAIRADHMVLDLVAHGDHMIVGTQSGRVDVYDRHTGDALPPVFVEPSVVGRAFAPTVRSLAISPDDNELAVVTSDGVLRRFALSPGSAATLLAEREVPALMVAQYLDDARLLLADMRGELALLDTQRDVELHRRQLDYDPIYAMALSPDRSLLAVASRSSRVQVVEPESGETRHVLKGHLDSVFGVDWIDDHTLVTAGKDKRVLAWNLEREDPQPRTLYRGDHFVSALGVDRHAGRMALPLEGFVVGVMQLADESIERRLEGHTAPVQHLVFVDEGRALISAGHDARVFVWNLEPGLESSPKPERR